MESPIRKYQKQKEYQRHKVLRKIKRRQQRKSEQMQKIAEKQLKRGLPKMDEGTEPEDDEFRYAQLPNGITVRFKNSSLQNGTYANYDNPEQRFQLDGTIDAQQAKRKSAFRSEDIPAYANALTGGFLLNLSPSQWARRGYDAVTGNLTPESWFGGNNGIVSNNFAQQHPYLSTGANVLFDAALFGIGNIKKPTAEVQTADGNYYINGADKAMRQDFVKGESMFPRWNQLVNRHVDYPKDIRQDFWNTTVSRYIKNRPFYKTSEMQNDINNIMNGEWGEFSSEAYEKAGYPNSIQGIYNDKNDFISIRKGADKKTLPHEMRHKFDEHFPLTQEENDILEQAYNNEFLDLPNRISEGSPVSGYKNIQSERVTTNRDARSVLLGPNHSKYSSLDQQNKIIESASDEEIINAVAKSNEYGRLYIDQLLFENDGIIPQQVINALRKSMQIVPVGTGMILMQPVDTYKHGKEPGIHINPANRGKFNALKRSTGKTTEQLTHSKNPLTRKRAIFAQNAKKWNH